MRNVLACVRTSLATQAITACAHQLGIASAVRAVTTSADALARLAEQPADVILADVAVTRPDTPGFTRRALAASPGALVVLFGAEDPQAAMAAVAAGARGVIRGSDLVTAVTKTLLLVASEQLGDAPAASGSPGGAGCGTATAVQAATVVPLQRVDRIPVTVTERGRRSGLTERELQVLRGMADGKSNAEIGRDLYVSEDTVKTHARRLFRKLGARDRAHAVASAFRAGLVS
ncbi:MAG TPA: response regulator transcription factor [Micromonosporaceae bacterium]